MSFRHKPESILKWWLLRDLRMGPGFRRGDIEFFEV